MQPSILYTSYIHFEKQEIIPREIITSASHHIKNAINQSHPLTYEVIYFSLKPSIASNNPYKFIINTF